jgi:hypothetical protein
MAKPVIRPAKTLEHTEDMNSKLFSDRNFDAIMEITAKRKIPIAMQTEGIESTSLIIERIF